MVTGTKGGYDGEFWTDCFIEYFLALGVYCIVVVGAAVDSLR
jgi:hypothetical protein